MKVRYKSELDILYIKLTDSPIEESDQVNPGIITDYTEDGSIVGIKLLNASRKMPKPTIIGVEVA